MKTEKLKSGNIVSFDDPKGEGGPIIVYPSSAIVVSIGGTLLLSKDYVWKFEKIKDGWKGKPKNPYSKMLVGIKK